MIRSFIPVAVLVGPLSVLGVRSVRYMASVALERSYVPLRVHAVRLVVGESGARYLDRYARPQRHGLGVSR